MASGTEAKTQPTTYAEWVNANNVTKEELQQIGEQFYSGTTPDLFAQPGLDDNYVKTGKLTQDLIQVRTGKNPPLKTHYNVQVTIFYEQAAGLRDPTIIKIKTTRTGLDGNEFAQRLQSQAFAEITKEEVIEKKMPLIYGAIGVEINGQHTYLHATKVGFFGGEEIYGKTNTGSPKWSAFVFRPCGATKAEVQERLDRAQTLLTEIQKSPNEFPVEHQAVIKGHLYRRIASLYAIMEFVGNQELLSPKGVDTSKETPSPAAAANQELEKIRRMIALGQHKHLLWTLPQPAKALSMEELMRMRDEHVAEQEKLFEQLFATNEQKPARPPEKANVQEIVSAKPTPKTVVVNVPASPKANVPAADKKGMVTNTAAAKGSRNVDPLSDAAAQHERDYTFLRDGNLQTALTPTRGTIVDPPDRKDIQGALPDATEAPKAWQAFCRCLWFVREIKDDVIPLSSAVVSALQKVWKARLTKFVELFDSMTEQKLGKERLKNEYARYFIQWTNYATNVLTYAAKNDLDRSMLKAVWPVLVRAMEYAYQQAANTNLGTCDDFATAAKNRVEMLYTAYLQQQKTVPVPVQTLDDGRDSILLLALLERSENVQAMSLLPKNTTARSLANLVSEWIRKAVATPIKGGTWQHAWTKASQRLPHFSESL